MTTPEEAVRAVGKGLHLRKSDSSQSYYGDFYEGEFEIDGKTIKVRVSTHPATGKRLGNANADKKVGIVIYKNGEHQDKGPHNGYIEYSYYPKDISPAESANAVIKGIEQLIKTGKYVDIRKNVRDKGGNIVDENKNWVVTSFDNNIPKSEKSPAATRATLDSNQGGRAVTPGDVSEGKVSEISSTVQGNDVESGVGEQYSLKEDFGRDREYAE